MTDTLQNMVLGAHSFAVKTADEILTGALVGNSTRTTESKTSVSLDTAKHGISVTQSNSGYSSPNTFGNTDHSQKQYEY